MAFLSYGTRSLNGMHGDDDARYGGEEDDEDKDEDEGRLLVLHH